MDKLFLTVIIYFVTGVIYQLIGYYALNINKRAKANQLFFVIMMLLSLWAWSYKNMTAAISPEKALYHWRISTLAWGSFFSILYHFIDVLYKPERKRTWKFYFVVYFPALINILIYSFGGDNTNLINSITKTAYGWDTIKLMPTVSYYFLCYYVLIIGAGSYTLFKWCKSTSESYLKWKLIIIGSTLLSTFALNLLLNIPSINKSGFPDITVTIMLIPFVLIFNSIKNRFILSEDIKIEDDHLLDQKLIKKIIKLNGYGYLISSFLLYVINYFQLNMSLFKSFLFSGSLYFLGIINFVFEDRINNKKDQYIWITFSASLLAAILRLAYDDLGDATAWTVLFYLLLITTIFDEKIYRYIIYAVILSIQIYSFYLRPSYTMNVNFIDQLGNIVVIIICIILAQFINNVLKQKLVENRNYLKKQKFITNASKALLSINSYTKNEIIDQILNDSLRAFDSQEVILIQLDKVNKKVNIIKHFSSKEQTLIITDNMRHEFYLAITTTLENKYSYYLDNINKLSKNYAESKESFRQNGIKSFAGSSILIEDELTGAVIQFYDKPLADNSDEHYISILANIISDTKNKLAYEEQLYKNANYDFITGLPNRHNFSQVVELKISDPGTPSFALIFIDLDNFKDINDAFGHNIGDEVLSKISKMLTNLTAKDGIVARFGGDEFLIMNEGLLDEYDALNFIKTLQENLKKPLEINNYDFRISASIGIAFYPNDGESVNALIKNADLAMYEAKQQGKNRYSFCSNQTKQQALENIQYTNKLFSALNNDEFLIYLQPQMSAKDGSIVGAEVLLRWNSNEFGFVPPYKFIPILEQTGLIIQVGRWVIKETIELLQKLKEDGRDLIRISVNLSSVQFQDENLIYYIVEHLQRCGISPSNLELEITESAAISDPEVSLRILHGIKAIGCQIAIDDFGVEFSSLNRLQKMPIDRLKIDKSFVDGIGKEKADNRKKTIVDIIVKLAQSLKLSSIAEGVETEEQLAFLRELGCEEIQGYLYSKPLTIEQFVDFVDTYQSDL